MALEKKMHITFNFHFRAFISTYKYANPTVPVAIITQAPSGRCQHCQGGKASALAVAEVMHVLCVSV